jgi:uncharacterized protein YegP (UPF0339 family)
LKWVQERYILRKTYLSIEFKRRMTVGKFEIYKDRKGEFRWRLRADNNQVIASGEGYTTKAACKNGIASVKKNAGKAKVEDQT